jgi:hypothetical protein
MACVTSNPTFVNRVNAFLRIRHVVTSRVMGHERRAPTSTAEISRFRVAFADGPNPSVGIALAFFPFMRFQFSGLGVPAVAVLLVMALCPAILFAGTRVVPRGGNLQSALNAAVPGDVVLLEAGAEYVGNFVLPVKSGDAPIVVRTMPSALLPLDGVRIQPGHASLLARIRSSNAMAALRTAAGAHHWEFHYVEFGANAGGYGDILQLGDGSTSQNTLDKVPHHLVLAHVYVHGDPLLGQKRCVSLNAAHVTIRDSYIADCKGVGMDTQAIGGWNGPGPYVIENNYLEGAGENVMFGGADPAIPNVVADGVVFRRNHVSRPLAWREPIVPMPQGILASTQAGGSLAAGVYAYRVVARRPVGQGTIGRSTASVETTVTVTADGGAVHLVWQAVPDATEYRVYGRTPGAQSTYWTVATPSFVDRGSGGAAGAVPTSKGTVWSVKNLFELKSARNVVVDANIFEHHWQDAQPGYAFVLTPRSGGTCSWCVVEYVRFENNLVRRVAAGFNILGYDDPSRPTRQTRQIVIRNNLFSEISTSYGGPGWFLLIGNGPREIVVDHNTISHSGSAIIYVYGGTESAPRVVYGLRFTNNAVRHNTYGIAGMFFSYGNAILQRYFPDGVVAGNYIAGAPASRYPAGTRTTGRFEDEFVEALVANYHLRETSQLRGTATDQGDIGADIGTTLGEVGNVEAGLPPAAAVTAPSGLRIVTP